MADQSDVPTSEELGDIIDELIASEEKKANQARKDRKN